jgi:hypothetical protein
MATGCVTGVATGIREQHRGTHPLAGQTYQVAVRGA